jgi:hypothetical protein
VLQEVDLDTQTRGNTRKKPHEDGTVCYVTQRAVMKLQDEECQGWLHVSRSQEEARKDASLPRAFRKSLAMLTS